MDVASVKKVVQDTPQMSEEQGRAMASFIKSHDIGDVLELGFRYGVSTCYMAGALQDLGRGHVTTIDREKMRDSKPNINVFLEKLGLAEYATAWFEPTSYTWRLMRMLEENPTPRFDLCYIDGAHDWFVDGFAFFLVDRLLRPGGWIIFDDVDWTFASSSTLRTNKRIDAMPLEERTTPQVRKIYELLVRTHPSYDRFRVEDGWAYAHKSAETVTDSARVVREVIVKRPLLSRSTATRLRQLLPGRRQA